MTGGDETTLRLQSVVEGTNSSIGSSDGEELYEDRLSADVSLDDVLRDKSEKIAALEKSNLRKDNELADVQSKLRDATSKHKEELYFMRLELDKARREQVASEEQLLVLYNDLQTIAQPQANEEDRGDDTALSVKERELSATVNRYKSCVEILENQVGMVKTSSGEVMKTLKDEITDLMEDKSRAEMNLLNQIAQMDLEHQQKEESLANELKNRDTVIQRLQSDMQVSSLSHDSSSTDSSSKPNEEDIEQLKDSLSQLERQIEVERIEAEEEICLMQETIVQLENDLDGTMEELDFLRSSTKAQAAVDALDQIQKDRTETKSLLSRVSSIWEAISESMNDIEQKANQSSSHRITQKTKRHDMLRCSLESASTIQDQVQASLVLIELRFRNQIQALRFDKLSPDTTSHCVGMMADVRLVQDETLAAIAVAGEEVSKKIVMVQSATVAEVTELKSLVYQKNEALKAMQDAHQELQDQVAHITAQTSVRSESGTPETPEAALLRSGGSSGADDVDQEGGMANQITKDLLARLEHEVMTVVAKVKERSRLVLVLQTEIQERKALEATLKKKLKRATRNKSVNSSSSKHRRQNGVTTAKSSSPNPSEGTSDIGQSPTSVADGLLSEQSQGKRLIKLLPSPREVTSIPHSPSLRSAPVEV